MYGLNGEQSNAFNESHHQDFLQEWEESEKLKNRKSINLNIMTKSKVEKIVEVKPWNGGSNGTIYYHSLVMDNGDKINIGKKKELAIGEELSYEIVDSGQEYNKAKNVMENPVQQNPKKNDDYVKGIEVGHAINNAVNLTCAGVELDIPECKTQAEKIYETAKVIMAISERLKSEA